MAKDFWDKFKISSDVLKDNKWLILILLGGVSSVATNAGQFMASLSYEADKEKAIHEVATGFQSIMAEGEPKTCSPCLKEINTHLRREH